MYDFAVFIGRFQPLHFGHKRIIDAALRTAHHVVILIGSAFEPRSLRNPWFFDEREAMIRSCYGDADNARITCEPIVDIRYNDPLWISQVQKAVHAAGASDDARVTLIGHESKGTNYYRLFFPQWDQTAVASDIDISATELRNHIFGGGAAGDLHEHVPPPILAALGQFMAARDGQALQQEHAFIALYKKGWDSAPFAPTHVTVDAVVVQSGHVLMVKRGAQPGKGLLALPGGFIQADETLAAAMVRKLREETGLKVPPPVILGSIKSQQVFDAPFRSARGRTITHAFHIELRPEEALPKIKSGGETSNCFWLPLGQLDSTQLFEDHYFIIQKMLGII